MSNFQFILQSAFNKLSFTWECPLTDLFCGETLCIENDEVRFKLSSGPEYARTGKLVARDFLLKSNGRAGARRIDEPIRFELAPDRSEIRFLSKELFEFPDREGSFSAIMINFLDNRSPTVSIIPSWEKRIELSENSEKSRSVYAELQRAGFPAEDASAALYDIEDTAKRLREQLSGGREGFDANQVTGRLFHFWRFHPLTLSQEMSSTIGGKESLKMPWVMIKTILDQLLHFATREYPNSPAICLSSDLKAQIYAAARLEMKHWGCIAGE